MLAFAAKIQANPVNLSSAATHMIAWVSGSMHLAPALDVSYCLGPTMGPIAMMARAEQHSEVVSLEPIVKSVVVGKKGRRLPKTHCAASDWAKSVYTTATELEVMHEMSWADALAIAEQAWRDGLKSVPPLTEEPDLDMEGEVSSEDGEDIEDVIAPRDGYAMIE